MPFEATRSPSTFEVSYEGVPPWDIGRPQRALVSLEAEGLITGSVLDVGCGTGENLAYFAERGHEAWGVDTSSRAIAKAEAKARARRLDVVLRQADALDLGVLERTFDTVLDCGVFHVFSDADRARYAASLAAVVRPGGRFVTLVFSDREPSDWGGPRRVRERDFAQTFQGDFMVREVRPARFETNLPHHVRVGGGEAWLAIVDRRG